MAEDFIDQATASVTVHAVEGCWNHRGRSGRRAAGCQDRPPPWASQPAGLHGGTVPLAILGVLSCGVETSI